ncbi:hypothetical protein AAE02nite_47030 [Adhaeribacter aerolatus]|uniref:Uncharacterized protein n=1 Tax=Adhaeribacter aerolatus TaxID=670289 RepID=A0A512B522_9BACT|nr:hypothetical protein [Adhaeribacter aerolatus]GEO07039.1 hypothetical protein AAE02nite_47030 [Adhaeribacter aerolatus]
MKEGQDLFSALDFTRFFPVQHKTTEMYYAIEVDRNPDFDKATQDDIFLCYLLSEAKEPQFQTWVILPREVLQLIPLML